MNERKKYWRKCPQCGSKEFITGRTVDIEYHHYPGKKIVKTVSSDYPFTFDCLKCGFRDISDHTIQG